MRIVCPHCLHRHDAAPASASACPQCGRTIEDPELFTDSSLSDLETLAGEAVLGPGTRLGRYVIEEKIGQGGMGSVWRGRDVELGRIVAIKTIRADEASDPNAVARFEREARAAAVLEHPNIVRVHDVGTQQGIHYYVMEHVAGRSLAAVLDAGDLSPRRAAEIVRDVARAVHFAHRRGILHRDIKPANILLAADGTPKLADFGLTRIAGDASITATSAALGTPNYMSPEQARSTKSATELSDVYSLGAVLYETLCGLPPFRGADPLEILRRVEHEDPVPPSRLRAVPRDLEVIALKALAKEPHRRYASAADLADDLDRWLRNEPIRARPPGWTLRARRWARRHPVVSVSAVLVVAALAAVAGVLWRAHVREQDRLKRELAIERAINSASIPYETAEKMGDPATRVRRRELLASAQQTIQQALALYPDTPKLHYWLGRIREAFGDRAGAIRAYDAAVQLQPDDVDARSRRAFVRLFEGIIRRADTAFYVTRAEREAFRADAQVVERHGRPDQAETAQALAALVELYSYEFGRPLDAGAFLQRFAQILPLIEEHAGRALEANPVNVEARLLRAHARYSRLLLLDPPVAGEERARVIEDLDHAARFRPNDSLIRHQRIWAFLSFGRPDEAATEAEHLVAIAPDTDESHIAQALVCWAQGKESAMWEAFDRALRCTNTPARVHALRALAHARMLGMFVPGRGISSGPDREAARREIDAAVSAKPALPVARYYRAQIRARLDQDLRGALEDVGAYLAMEPENPYAHVWHEMWRRTVESAPPVDPSEIEHAAQRARRALSEGRWGAAVLEARRAVDALGGVSSRTPRQQELLVEMYFTAAAGLSAQGRLDQAILDLEAAVAEGFRDWTRLEQEPALGALRADPRFPELLRRWTSPREF